MGTPANKKPTKGSSRPKKYEEKVVIEGDFMDVIKAAGKARKVKNKKKP